MTLLHTINRSPFSHSSWQTCLRLAEPGSSILLFEDGVYAGLKLSIIAPQMQTALTQYTIYALDNDAKTRGIQTQLLDGIQLIDYAGFVKLVVEHQAVQNW